MNAWDPSKPGQQEGDSPSFLHLASALRGLNDPEQPNQPGWGGRFVRRDPSRNHLMIRLARKPSLAGAPKSKRISPVA